MTSRTFLGRLAGGLIVLALGACGSSDAQSSYSAPKFGRPDIVEIEDFAVVAGDIPAPQQATARRVGSAAAEALAREVLKLGFAAARAGTGATAGTAAHVRVTGQFLPVDEGNPTRRNLIGLAAGGSKVEAEAQFFYVATGARPGEVSTRKLGSVVVTAQSSRKSGGGGDVLATDVDALAAKMAEEIAKKLAALFRTEGWIVEH